MVRRWENALGEGRLRGPGSGGNHSPSSPQEVPLWPEELMPPSAAISGQERTFCLFGTFYTPKSSNPWNSLCPGNVCSPHPSNPWIESRIPSRQHEHQ